MDSVKQLRSGVDDDFSNDEEETKSWTLDKTNEIKRRCSSDENDEDTLLVQLVRKASRDNSVKKKKSGSKIETEDIGLKRDMDMKKTDRGVMGEEKPARKRVRGKKREGTNSMEENKIKIKEEPIDEQRKEEEEEEYKWWLENEKRDTSLKWETLEHNGVYFPSEYVPHNIPMKYGGYAINLFPEAEEIATFYAGVIGTQYAENPVFRSNFFNDFRKVLWGTQLYFIITRFEDCDFTMIHEYLVKIKEHKRNRSREEKRKEKEEREKIQEKYGYCIIDGRQEKVGNFRMEPPGLFRGRGDHPKTGRLKRRIQPEHLTLNLGFKAPIPRPPDGHRWGKIVCDQTVTWIASWIETINQDAKYVFLAPGSRLKGISDLRKFERARELKEHVDRIRALVQDELLASDEAVKQRATAIWLIDKLALRAGNEKGDDEADTVGCCSLRVEHLTLEKSNMVTFDFLGKDSIRYFNQVSVPQIIFKNLGSFMKKPKKDQDLLFDRLSTSILNKYLTKLMPYLTAKVFRTYNASIVFQDELKSTPLVGTVLEKILAYNRANRQVAILCNHQRAVPKSHVASMERLTEKILGFKYERQHVRDELKGRKLSRQDFEETFFEELSCEWESELDEDIMEKRTRELEAKKEEKLESSQSSSQKDGEEDHFEKKRGMSLSLVSDEKLYQKFVSLKEKISILKSQRIDRDEGKQTSLGTSKINYIDPRITVAWCKKYGVPLERMLNKTLKEKFRWALDVSGEWEF